MYVATLVGLRISIRQLYGLGLGPEVAHHPDTHALHKCNITVRKPPQIIGSKHPAPLHTAAVGCFIAAQVPKIHRTLQWHAPLTDDDRRVYDQRLH